MLKAWLNHDDDELLQTVCRRMPKNVENGRQ